MTDAEVHWFLPTRGDGVRPWRVGHIDISIGLTLGLLDSLQDGQPGRDRVSFFIADRAARSPAAWPASAGGLAPAAGILDDLLGRRTVAGRPADLADDEAWVRAASGRVAHPDPRLPLII